MMRRKNKIRADINEIISLCETVLSDKENTLYRHESIFMIENIFLPEFRIILENLVINKSIKKVMFTSSYHIIDSSDFQSVIAIKILDFEKKNL
jgi:hypothetical protein